MQLHSNRPRRPEAKAADSDFAWHEWLTHALFTALSIFIGLRLLLAIPGSQPAIATVGDQIAINDAGGRFIAIAPAFTVTEGAGSSARRCRLDIAAMKHQGGVFSVIAAGPGGIRLSWAGGPTAAGEAGCKNREVMMNADDYATLLRAGPQNINAR
jgi:hypothetical protein